LFNREKVDPVRTQLDALKRSNCFVSQADRAEFTKKLLDLECRVEGITIFVQTTVKDLLEAEMIIIHGEKNKLIDGLNAIAFNARMYLLSSNPSGQAVCRSVYGTVF